MTQVEINDYRNALVEVDEVLNCLDIDAYNKIPQNIIQAIKENKNENYQFYYDEDLDYEEWNLSSKAKAILYNIYRDYIATEEEKKYFKDREKFELYKIEKEKINRYNSKDIFEVKNKRVKDSEQKNEVTDLIQIKEKSVLSKILGKVKKFLDRLCKL